MSSLSIRQRLDRIQEVLDRRSAAPTDSTFARYSAIVQAMMDSVGGKPAFKPTPRWTTLRFHPVQYELWHFDGRFAWVPAGRRSGKTEIGKRKIVREAVVAEINALRESRRSDDWFIFGAPTHDQAKNISWEDLKVLIPGEFIDKIYEGDRRIRLLRGTEISVIGMDKPQRAEGRPLSGGVLDEYADMKEVVLSRHVRPALADKMGWLWLTGVPEGRNHYFEGCEAARVDETGESRLFTWWSEDILPASEIEALKKSLDEASFEQEIHASFNIFKGRIYYAFDRNKHATSRLEYHPGLPLVLCFDFNVDPGVCVYVQERTQQGDKTLGENYTAVIGEVHIPRNSNTASVCRKIIADWGAKHKGEVFLYGDPAGGHRSTQSEVGSDWDIIRDYLKPVFGARLKSRVARSAPRERARINAMNHRILTKDGVKHMLVDPVAAKHTLDDLEAVCAKEGSNGEIDDDDGRVSHLTDALGYYIWERWPPPGSRASSSGGM